MLLLRVHIWSTNLTVRRKMKYSKINVYLKSVRQLKIIVSEVQFDTVSRFNRYRARMLILNLQKQNTKALRNQTTITYENYGFISSRYMISMYCILYDFTIQFLVVGVLKNNILFYKTIKNLSSSLVKYDVHCNKYVLFSHLKLSLVDIRVV